MKDFAKFHYFYNTIISEVLRTAIFLLLFLLAILGFVYKLYPNLFITLFGLFLIFEIYFLHKVNKLLPKTEVSKNDSNPFDSFTIEALGLLESQKNQAHFIAHLVHFPQVKFILDKADIFQKEVPVLEIDRAELSKKALEIAKKVNGKYITTMDLISAYLLLTEGNSNLLFNKKIKQEDLENILIWARHSFPKEESSKNTKLNFVGEGIAESWVYGWTIESQKYLLDVSSEFINSDKEPVGRENEYKLMLEAMHKGSSVMLIGDTGSGKETLVKKLAIESYAGLLGEGLMHQKVMQLMVDAFMAGAQTQGEIEERLKSLMEEVMHSGNTIMYIPEFQNILGNESFHLDMSGAIIPYVDKGKIKIIATVTPGAYKKFIEPLHALLDGFSVINLEKIEEKEIVNILFQKTFEIENKNKVSISYKAILAACKYAQNYSKERALPGSAILLLEDSANAVALLHRSVVEEQDILDQVTKKTHVEVGEPKAIEKTLLLNLETELHKRIIGQNYAVSAISEAIRRVRAGLKDNNKPISFLFLGPTGVGKTETAKALAQVYYGQDSNMIRLDMSEFIGEDGMKKLLGSPPGEGDEKGALTEAVFDNPYSLILLDEFEKADQKVLDLFLQVLDDGRLTDGKGKTVSFVNSIIIATSNAASEYIRENVEKGAMVDKQFRSMLLENLQTKAIFKPELLNRFDDVIVFNPLNKEEILQVVNILILEFSKNLIEKDIQVEFDTNVIQKVANEGFDREFGARPIKRFIADKIEDIVAKKMLSDEIKRGDKIKVVVNSEGNIDVVK